MYAIFAFWGEIIHSAPVFWMGLIAFFNIMCFAMFGIDKYCAVHRKLRTPEALLICCSLLASATGSFIGMLAFNHKTAKPLFYLTLPVLSVAQLAVITIAYC